MSVVADTTHELTQALVQHRTDLLRYAKLQLRNDAWAEDVVSEVFIVALEKPEAFEGRSQIKTWLIGILKFKILDKFRQMREKWRCQNQMTLVTVICWRA